MSPTGSFGTPMTRGRGLRVDATRFAGGAVRSPGPSLVCVVVGVVSSVIFFSPARLRHARQLALERALAEADPAEAELPHVAAWAAADLAAVVALHLELRRALRLEDEALLCHLAPLRLLAERHAEALEQSARLFIRLRGRDDRDLHATQAVDLVVVDLGEHQLLLQTEREVAAAVERAVRNALEVADARERDGDELLVEVPHALAAERDLDADGHADAQLEVRDGLARLRDHRTLAGDDREVVRGGVHGLAVADGLAHPDVHDDLLQARDAHDVVVRELLAQLVLDALVVALLHRAGDRHQAFSSTTIGSPQRLQRRSLVSSSDRCATRVGLPQCGHTTMTLPSDIGIG